MSVEALRDKNNKFNNLCREMISRALAGETVVVPTDNRPKFKSVIRFLDFNDEIEIREYKLGIILHKRFVTDTVEGAATNDIQ